jgi:hypothetical protein
MQLATLLLGLLVCVQSSEAQVVNGFEAYMYGSEVVPPTSSSGIGYISGVFQLNGCKPSGPDSMDVYVVYFSLAGC